MVAVGITAVSIYLFIFEIRTSSTTRSTLLQSEQVNKHTQKFIETLNIFWAYTNKVSYICLNNSSFSAEDNPFADNPNLQSVNSTIVLILSYSLIYVLITRRNV